MLINDVLDNLGKTPDFGYALEGEWDGCYSVHVGRDRYRVIWEMLPEEDDYTRGEGAKVIPIVVLRIGPKTDNRDQVIYNQGRPES